MYLKELRLWNFRKYGSAGGFDINHPNLVVTFNQGLNLLIGENDSGKTAIIDAVKIILKTHGGEWIGLDEYDFYQDALRLRIECLFVDLSDDEAANFEEWISWSVGTPSLSELKVFIDAERSAERIAPFDVRAGNDLDGTPIYAEAREYLKTTYLRPLRNAKGELIPRRNSRLSQILKAHPAFRTNSSPHYLVEEFEKFNATIENYFEGLDNAGLPLIDEEGKALKQEIDKYLKAFSSFKSLFSVSEAELKTILERLELTFDSERNLGLGSHNILFMAAELLHLNRADWKGLRLGLIEEIEAHLHPQMQLRVIDTLQQLNSIQLIITTHSPNIGSKIGLQKITICNAGTVYPMASNYTKLQAGDYSFLKRFLDVTKSNLFFAKGVIMVEGWAEELLLPSLAAKMGISLTEKGVSVVNIGNTAFLRYSLIFQRNDGKILETPVSVITDLDVLPSDESVIDPSGVTKAELARTKEENKFDGRPVKTFVSNHWTLEYCIARSTTLRKHLFDAIVLAGDEMQTDGYTGKKVLEDWATFSGSLDDETLAFKIYNDLIGNGKKISKSIIAQQLAQILDALPGDGSLDIENQNSIKYLTNAIKYACRLPI